MLRLRLMRIAAALAVAFALTAGPVTSVDSHGPNSAAITNALPSFADPGAVDEVTREPGRWVPGSF